VLIQATGLALLAALSPTALLVAAVYLGSARPRLVGAFYLAGALIMTVVMSVLVLLLLRNIGLSHTHQRTPRYELRLGLGILLVAVAVVLARRRRQSKSNPPDPGKAGSGIVSRMVANPGPWSAFAVGVILFAPGVTFIAALQVIATANASVELTVVAVAIVVIINLLLVWLPLVLHLVAPGVTTRRLTAFNGWLRANGSTIFFWAILAGGAILIFDGIYGLVTGG
jgi:hypothetical protein